MTQTEALRLALEASEIDLVFLRNVKPFKGQKDLASDCVAMTEETITAIKAALEAKDEPVAWMDASRFEELRNGFTVMTTLTKKKAFFDDVAIYTTPPQQEAKDEPVAWVPYLSDRADGVQGHYAIARWNPRGYREVWNLRRHTWGAFSDDVMSLEEADYLLQKITIPTRKPTPPAQPVIDESTAKRIATTLGWEPKRKPLTDEEILTYRHMIDWTAEWSYNNFARAIEAAHGIKGEA